MNLRCSFCQTPFSIGRTEKIAALQHLYAENLTHYDAHCPRCRRSTPVLRQKLEMTLPNWREALKELEVEMAEHPQAAAAPAKPEAAPVAEAKARPEPAKSKGSGGGSKPKTPSAPANSPAGAGTGSKPPAKDKTPSTKGQKKGQ